MRLVRILLVLLAFSAVFAPVYSKNCTKGKSCGNTCISMSYTCHVGSSSSGSSSSSSTYEYNSSSSTPDYDDYSYDEDVDEIYNYDDNYTNDTDYINSGGSYGSNPHEDSTPVYTSDASLSSSSTLVDSVGIEIIEIYTGVPTVQAYDRTKVLLGGNDFSEAVNIVYAENLTISFSESSSGLAVMRLQGSNADLMGQILAEFEF